MDCGAIMFGFFLIPVTIMGEKTSLLTAIIAAVIFWIFDFLLSGFICKFKEC